MRFATYNVEWFANLFDDGGKLLDVIFRYIRAVNPEVTSRQLMDHLKPVLEDDYHSIAQAIISDAELAAMLDGIEDLRLLLVR